MSISRPRGAPRASGAAVTPVVDQGEWLIRLGIEARAQALASAPTRTRGRDRVGARAPHRRRSDGRAVQGHGDPFARLAGAGGVRNDRHLSRRDAGRCRRARPRLPTTSFCDTFAHLYRPRISTPSSRASALERLGERARRSGAIAFRLAEVDGERRRLMSKLGPLKLPGRDRRPGALELRQLYVLKAWHGRRHRGAQLMDWVIAEARRRGARRALSHRLHRQPPRPAILRALRLRGGRAATTSWSATTPTRTSSCGRSL